MRYNLSHKAKTYILVADNKKSSAKWTEYGETVGGVIILITMFYTFNFL